MVRDDVCRTQRAHRRGLERHPEQRPLPVQRTLLFVLPGYGAYLVSQRGEWSPWIEFFLRGRFSSKLGWWLNYTWSSVEDEIGGETFPRSFDQTHALNLDLDYRINDHWTLNLAWRYHTGWPTTPLGLGEEIDEDGQTVFVPLPAARFSARLSDYHRLDLRATRLWNLRAGTLVLFIDVQNVYDRGNIAGFDFSIDQEEGTLTPNAEEWAGILPSVGVSFEF